MVGWLPGQGTHKDLGSLIVAVNDDGGLRHAGQVGSGINARMRKELLTAMEPIRRDDAPLVKTPRLPLARWVEPRIVIRAEFTDWTRDGLLRQAAFKGSSWTAIPRRSCARRRYQPRGSSSERHPPTAAPASARRRPMVRPTRRPRRCRLRGGVAIARDGPHARQSRRAEGAGWAGARGALDGGRREVRVTNLDKVLIPADGEQAAVTKRDLLRHYVTIGPTMLPHLAGRGLNLQRFPDGIGKMGFGRRTCPATPRSGSVAGATPGTRARRTTWWSTRSPLSPGSRRRPPWSCIPGRPVRSRRTSRPCPDRRGSGRAHDLGRGADPHAAVSHRAGAPGRHRRAQDHRQAGIAGPGCRCAAATASTRRATGSSSCR